MRRPVVCRNPKGCDSPAPLPQFPIGENTNLSSLIPICPKRDYQGCFSKALSKRYPSPELFDPRDVVPRTAADYARLHFSSCTMNDVRGGDDNPMWTGRFSDDGPGESFVSSALVSVSDDRRIFPPLPNADELRRRLRTASTKATLAAQAKALRPDGAAGASESRGSLRCSSPASALDARLLMLIGLPTTAKDPRRREAARGSWMRHAAYGRSIGACFLLSAHAPAAQMDAMIAEHATFGDLLFLDAVRALPRLDR